MAWYYILLITLYAVTTISLVVVVLADNRNPVKSLAWVMVLTMVPIGGAVLYAFFGRNLKNTRMISRRNRRLLRRRQPHQSVSHTRLELTTASRQTIRMASTLTGAIYYPANKVEVFTLGTTKFERLMADIEAATTYIHIQYYIFTDDTIGRHLADMLISKARQGVEVRVIYDHVGSLATSNKFFAQMRSAGIEVHPFFRVTFPRFATHINWRNHRKIAVIDGRIGYIGGMNVADRYLDSTTWRDTHLRIEGPAAAGLHYTFAVDWSFMGQPLIDSSPTPLHHEPTSGHNAGVITLTSGPTDTWSNIAMLIQKAVGLAKHRVYIQTPYFLPTEALLRTLQAAALTKLDVRIMMPAHSDSAVLTYASRSYINECLTAGIKIYLYDAGMLHAKTIIVDDEFSSVGSTNIDFRSFEHNFESNAFVYSSDVNEALRQAFIDDMTRCTRVTREMWVARPQWQKIAESTFRLLSPVL